MQRFYSGDVIVRASDNGGAGMLSGYAAVYDQPTTRQDTFEGTEQIARGAFDGLLDGDVIAVLNHDPGQLLGRTASGTLRLSSDDHGLAFELDLPDTSLGRDVRELVRRGDLSGMSFAAYIGKVDRTKAGATIRSFESLVDVSVVVVPAYPGTNVVARNASTGQSVRGQLARIKARRMLEGS